MYACGASSSLPGGPQRAHCVQALLHLVSLRDRIGATSDMAPDLAGAAVCRGVDRCSAWGGTEFDILFKGF